MNEALRKIYEQGKDLGRALTLDKEKADQEQGTLDISFSSSEPYERFDMWDGVYYDEILDHSEGSIRTGRLMNGASVRDTHYGDQVGVVEEFRLDKENEKGRALIRFSKHTERAKEIYADILDGIRRNVSFRYIVHGFTEEKNEAGKKVIRIKDWEPVHISIEPDPADWTVGIGRSMEEKNKLELIINQRRDEMKDPVVSAGVDLAAQEELRVRNIEALASDFKDKVKGLNLTEIKSAFIHGNKPAEDFSDLIMKNIEEQRAVAKPVLELTAKEKKLYSLSRAVRYLLTRENCLEKEISDSLSKELGQSFAGIGIPHTSFMRDLTAGGAASGAELVGTNHLGGEFIELLQNEMVSAKAGVRYLPNLKGNIEIPKLSTGAGHGWAATEVTAVEEGNPVTAEITLSPKKGGRFVDVSRQLMIQGDPNAERIFTDDLIQALAVAADAVILHGTGANGQPQGIVGSANVGSVPGTNLNWAGVLSFKKALNLANVRVGERYFMANPTTVAVLQAREKVAGQAIFLCGEDMRMAGYPTLETNQVLDDHIIYGAFNHVLVGLWGGVDLTVDPYTQRTSGIVRLIADQLMDVAIRHAGAFAVCSDFS